MNEQPYPDSIINTIIRIKLDSLIQPHEPPRLQRTLF